MLLPATDRFRPAENESSRTIGAAAFQFSILTA
jgi:hypothetical protein